MARAQKLLTPVRISGTLSDLGTQQWSMSLNKSGFIVPVRTVTASGDITEDDRVVLVDAGSGKLSMDVYSTSSNAGAMVTIKKKDTSTNTVTITTEGSDTIDGQAELYLQAPYDSVTLVSDGSNWFVI